MANVRRVRQLHRTLHAAHTGVRVIVPLLAQQAPTASGYGAPMTVALVAGIRVHAVTAARAWYERLLGEPSFFRNATVVAG